MSQLNSLSSTSIVLEALSGDMSIGPQCLQALSAEQKLRLSDILDDYLRCLERGIPPQRSELLDRNPDLIEALGEYLSQLESLHNAAGGLAAIDRSDNGEAYRLHSAGYDDITASQKRLGDFVLLREVGRGGMGVVYEARQLSLARRVALKVLPFAAVLDSQQIARFKNEAHAAAQLHHPNIVPVFAVGTDRGVHYFAMQFIDGQTLDCALEELRSLHKAPTQHTRRQSTDTGSSLQKAFTDRHGYFRAVMRLGIQAAEALQAAHDYGVIHRDIKPSNLMLDNSGKLWITDFGLARCQSDITLTRTGDVVGTLRYMSPEQASGQSALVDQRTDVYSLGATLYELSALRPAFDAEDATTLRRQIDSDEPPRLRQHQPLAPVDLETVIAKAMSKQREDRYFSAQELADDLRRVLDGKPTMARAPAALDRLAKLTRRHSRIVAATAAVCAILAVGLSASLLLIGHEKNRAEQNLSQAEKHFKQAQQTVDRFGSRLAERLADVPGAETVRHELLRETLAYYRSFAEDAQHDLNLRGDLAQTYSKIGSLADELGSATEAIRAHQDAIQLFEQLAGQNPQVADYRLQLAIAKNNLGMALHRHGNTTAAIAALQSAIALQHDLQKASDSNDLQLQLATSYSNLGLVQSECRQVDQAAKSYAAATDLLEKTPDSDARDPQRLRHLAATYNNLAALKVDDAPDEAAKLYEIASLHQADAALALPDDLKQQSALALTLNNLGTTQSRLKRFAEATASLARAIELQEALVRRIPSNQNYPRDLAVSYNNLGLAQTRAKLLAAAESSFDRALKLQTELVRKASDAEAQSCLGGIYNNLGMVQEESRRFAEAAKNYQAAIRHQQLAMTSAASVHRYREFLSKHYYNYGRTLRELNRGKEAAQAALARKELWPGDSQRLFSIAEELGQATKLLQTDANQQRAKTECASLTVATLQAAAKAGFELPPNLSSNAAFASVRDLPDFAALTTSQH